MNVKEARRLTDSAVSAGRNARINTYLSSVKAAALNGQRSIVINDDSSYISLTKEDMDWFEREGYTVKRPKITYFIPRGTPINNLVSYGIYHKEYVDSYRNEWMIENGSISW